MNRRGIALLNAYEQRGSLSLLRRSVAQFRRTLAVVGEEHPNRAAVLGNLSAALLTSFERTGEVELLVEALDVSRAAVAAATAEGPSASALNNLGLILWAMYKRTGDTAALAEAIEIGRAAVATGPEDDPDRTGYLNNVGCTLQAQFARTGEVDPLIEAVGYFRAAVALPDDGVGNPMHLSNLGSALSDLFAHIRDTALLDEAIESCRRAVAATPARSPHRADYLTNLGGALHARFEQSGDYRLVVEAFEAYFGAFKATPAKHPNMALHMSNLGAMSHILYERTGKPELLALAVKLGRISAATAPLDHPDRAMLLTNLGAAVRSLPSEAGETSEAVEAGREALDLVPADHPDRAVMLSTLSGALFSQFERTGLDSLLEEAAQAGRDALAAVRDHQPNHATMLNNLGLILRRQYERTGETRFLLEAADLGRAAVEATAPDRPDRAANLSNLGRTLQTLFEATGDVAALDEAAKAAVSALGSIPEDHPDRIAILGNLGHLWLLRCQLTDDPALLDEAVAICRAAVAAASAADTADRPDRAATLSNLSITLMKLYERTGEPGPLREAAKAGRAALAATPADHPDQVTNQNNLAVILRILAQHAGQTGQPSRARRLHRRAAANEGATTATRINAYRHLAVMAGHDRKNAAKALAAAEAAVALLPQLTPRALIRADREHRLGRLGSLAGTAAMAALAAGRPERAVELLEQTRGLLVADLVDARNSDLTRLRQVAPDLAAAFEELRERRERLDRSSAARAIGGVTLVDRAERAQQARQTAADLAMARRAAVQEWEDLTARIRALDGFAGFLAAPDISELARQAQDGPVVFVVADDAAGAALILTGDPAIPVHVVGLDQLTDTAAQARADQLIAAQKTAAGRDAIVAAAMAPSDKTAREEILDVLAWLWDTVTEPVLIALGHVATPEGSAPWPHVRWCPVGVLGYLPLHAAGHHNDLTSGDTARRENPRTVLDRVISTYTPTVRALAYARAHPAATAETLIVAVPDAPATRPLSGAADEAIAIRALIPDAHALPRPTRDTVLQALPGHPVAHFACHGRADRTNPADSRLILHDHQTAPLTVADINALRITGALAYLSACDTAVPAPSLADESIHLAGAFHLAGYQHVIGTLWPVDDRVARILAESFYARLTCDGTAPPGVALAAQALHDATCELRGRFPAAPELWAAYTHTGI
jgi:CHAT domain/Tetratricopeptide repeat